MKASYARLSAAVSVLGLLATPALAQMMGNPVYFNQSGGVGVTINADYGRGVNNASGKTNYFGGRATLGLPMVAITLGAGSAKPSGGTSMTSFGGDVAVTLVKGPMVPVKVALQAGGAYSSVSGTKTTRVPAGLVLTFNVKSPGASVEPWIAPRVDYTHVSVGGASGSSTHAGASAGLNVGLPSGLGFHVALDYVYVKGAGGLSSSDLSPFTVGAGIHYAIKVPSLVPGTGM
jgi:hypothetical protein